MRPKEKISKLEGLLARVKERAEAPRPNGAVAFAAVKPAPAPAAVAPAAAPSGPVVTFSEPPEEVLDAEVSYSEDVSFGEASVEAQPLPHEGEPTLGAADGENAEVDEDAVTAVGRKAFDAAHAALADAAAAAEADGAFDNAGDAGDAEVSIEGEAELSVEGDAELEIDGDSEVDVGVSAEVVELGVDDEPAVAAAATSSEWPVAKQSGAQPVADHSALDEPVVDLGGNVESVEIDGDAPAELEEVTEEAPEVVESPAAALANEVEEPAPSSSPRPIGPTTTTYETSTTYDEDSAPRHTPPPESGKQVAVASVKPEPRLSSIPPAEGHSLVGGWREPGMAIPRDGSEATRAPGFRGPVTPAQAAPPPPPSAAAPRPGGAPASTRKGPEVTQADLPAGAGVAAVEGASPSFRVSTFGELLDATLSL